jgi:UDP-N-acetylglucosamine acyltransferase
MTVRIHPTAIVHDGAQLGADVEIGAYAMVGENCTIGDGSIIAPRAILERNVILGKEVKIGSGTILGGDPQDLKFKGEMTTVEVGDGTTIREYSTINRGTTHSYKTSIGKNCFIMSYVHLAHDCQVGSHTIFANCTQLAGHVTIEDWVILGGFTGVHQHVRVGAHSFTGIGTHLTQDLPPYVTAAGEEGKPFGLNSNGLKRRGFSAEAINAIKRAYRTLYRSGLSLAEAKSELEKQATGSPEVRRFLDFINNSERGIVR